MGLFDSGPRDPGSSFAYSFFGAGEYPVIDSSTGREGTVEVPTRVSPPQGSESTEFQVRWAEGRLPAGYVADIQVLRPGSSEFEDWLIGQTEFKGSFTPDAGPGTYEFRARVRSLATGAASGYSLPTSIDVT